MIIISPFVKKFPNNNAISHLLISIEISVVKNMINYFRLCSVTIVIINILWRESILKNIKPNIWGIKILPNIRYLIIAVSLNISKQYY